MNYRNHDFQDLPSTDLSYGNSSHKKNWFYNTKILSISAKLMYFMSFCMVCCMLVFYVINQPYFQIQNINVYSPNIDVNFNSVQSKLGAKQYSFFSLSLNKIRDVFESLPSVKSSHITRKYPNTIDVQLEKHIPFAYWGLEENTYVNADGIVYEGSNNDKNINNVYLYGNDKQARAIIDKYLFLSKMFNYKIISLTYSVEGNWIVILSNPIDRTNLNLRNIQTTENTQLKNTINTVSAENAELQKPHSDYLKITLGRDDQIGLAKKITFWQKNWQKLKIQPEYAQINTFDLRHDGFAMRKTMQKIVTPKKIQLQNNSNNIDTDINYNNINGADAANE